MKTESLENLAHEIIILPRNSHVYGIVNKYVHVVTQ